MLALDSERTSLSFSTAFWGLFSLPFPLDISAVKGGLLYLEIDQKTDIKIIYLFFMFCDPMFVSSGVNRNMTVCLAFCCLFSLSFPLFIGAEKPCLLI